jgi:hypothetical protein
VSIGCLHGTSRTGQKMANDVTSPQSGESSQQTSAPRLPKQPGPEIYIKSDHSEKPDIAPIAPSAVDPAANRWIAWFIALAAILLPIIVLLSSDSIPKFDLIWHGVNSSVQHGDFLVPVLVMCAEAIRLWWQDVRCGKVLRRIRRVATIACGSAIVLCLIAFTKTSSAKVTVNSGRSILVITLSCFVAAAIFGTGALMASQRGS